MKKIGLLTFHDTTNFGSWLQTYGLYDAICRLGYECNVIDYKCDEITKREIPKKFAFSFNPKTIIKDILFTSVQRRKYSALKSITEQKMVLSPACNRSSIPQVAADYDKIVIGSDIVWGLDITNYDMSYFLDFISSKDKKIAFSSSIGTPWTPEQIKKIRKYLIDFEAIAMRETDAAQQVESIINRPVETVCDPTMLVDKQVWADMATHKREKTKYCLVYFDTHSGEALNYAKNWAAKNHAKVKFINYGLPKSGVENVRPVTVGDFLGLIKDAEFICTASYHGLLFSIYFNRQFRYFNRAHKSRMESLTQKLGVNEFNGECDLNEFIDYGKINKIVSEFRAHSMSVLKGMLGL